MPPAGNHQEHSENQGCKYKLAAKGGINLPPRELAGVLERTSVYATCAELLPAGGKVSVLCAVFSLSS